VAANNSKEKRRRALRTVRRYLARYRGGLFAGGICLLLTDILLLANPWILKLGIDGLDAGITREQLIRYALLLIAVTLVSGVFRFGMRRIIIGISRKIEMDVRADFFAHLESHSPAFYHRHRTGDLMALATNDLNAVRMLVGPGVMYTLNTIVVGCLSLSLMLVLSWKLTVAVLVPMALLIFSVYKGMKVIHRLFEMVQQRFAAINSRAQENLAGIRVVKAYAREAHEAAHFEELSEDYVHHNMKLFRVQSLLHPLLTTIAGLGGLVILLVGGLLVVSGAITLGTFVAFSGYLTMLVWPMIAIGWVMNITERGLASMQRIDDVMAQAPEIVDAPGAEQANPDAITGRSIRFEDVSFSYAGGRDEVLHDLNFEIGAGETVAVVGPTGSGKTTLVSLILRMYDPTAGRILVGGQPADRIPLSWLRGMIGLVPQDIFLFSETIAENIGFGVNGLAEPVLRRVSETASIHDEIMGFPNGYESRVGERGINLSGGQKQRVAIARALARDPDVLILDDALSSVDATTEENILSAMEGEMKKRTSIVITHRVSSARYADRIFVLDEGRLVDAGTHEELVERGGIYAEMHHKQMIMVDLEEG
jgi:ATP-binding cassette subfamily B protein